MATVDIALAAGLATATLTPAGAVIARGIPYGVAERFRAATPFPSWPGRRDASRRGPICPQTVSRLAWLIGDITEGLVQDENCLVLSVTAPAEAAGLPVMVWFHGGAYLAGTGEAAVYDADALALEGEVVVVSVSYRIGLFGYLTPDGFGDSNVGLRDQLLALRWVRENIGAFGGDPGRVTAFGQSAGADSVLALMLSPAADGLFHRAILQSAPLRMRQNRGPMTTAMRMQLAEALRRDGSTPAGATIAQLLKLQKAINDDVAAKYPAGQMAYGPLGEETPLVRTATESARLKEVAPRIELLIGHTAADAAPYLAMARTKPGQVPAADFDDSIFREAQEAMTRAQFTDPEAALVKDWTEAGGAACTYRVDWAPPGAPMGACHCIEIPLLFGTPQTWAGTYMLGTADDPIDHTLAKDMRRSWCRFAHDGVASTPMHLAIGA
ncbi:carboxylesterase family protein [Mycolicibacterium llatzerense]|uniref:carboxylesterase family protein n=1 Tax=Mycolicibacterium llatzerense TaxID=280871 RepID=UPI0031D0B604